MNPAWGGVIDPSQFGAYAAATQNQFLRFDAPIPGSTGSPTGTLDDMSAQDVNNILGAISRLQGSIDSLTGRAVVTGYAPIILQPGQTVELPVAPQMLFNIVPQSRDGSRTSVSIVIANDAGAPLAEKVFTVEATVPNVHASTPASGRFGDIANAIGDATITNNGPGVVAIFLHG
jgi:hypothetical protein